MSKIKLTGSNSGYVEISSAADAGNLTLALPTSGTELLSNGNNVYTGITTFSNDVKFEGASYDALWDASDNQLEFGNNAKLSFGSSSDLQVSFDSANSLIAMNTGSLSIINYANNEDVKILSDNGSGGVANYIIADGGTGEVLLHHYGNEKFKTTNTGAVVTGILTATEFIPTLTQLSHRNKARNGELRVSQRATTFSPTNSDMYLMDGWMTQHGSGGNLDCTVTHSDDTPAGFAKSLKITPDSTNTPSGSQNGMIAQRLEGQDFQDLAFGSSDAKPITVSWYA